MSILSYFNQFRPLAESGPGRAAIVRHSLPPFVDASCRREPDFESATPSITALCRGAYFAPLLQEGDVVAYMTKEFVYPPKAASARRLVAVLRVIKTWRPEPGEPGTAAHQRAAAWYSEKRLPLPSNCMVPGNRPLPLEKTDRYQANLRLWDRHYRQVANEHGVFHACETAFCDVNNPPRLTNRQLVGWFGTIPDTRLFAPLPRDRFAECLRWLAGQAVSVAHRGCLEALITLLASE